MDNNNNKNGGSKFLRGLLTVLLALLATAVLFITLQIVV